MQINEYRSKFWHTSFLYIISQITVRFWSCWFLTFFMQINEHRSKFWHTSFFIFHIPDYSEILAILIFNIFHADSLYSLFKTVVLAPPSLVNEHYDMYHSSKTTWNVYERRKDTIFTQTSKQCVYPKQLCSKNVILRLDRGDNFAKGVKHSTDRISTLPLYRKCQKRSIVKDPQ